MKDDCELPERAPRWTQRCGLDWTFRWRRSLGDCGNGIWSESAIRAVTDRAVAAKANRRSSGCRASATRHAAFQPSTRL